MKNCSLFRKASTVSQNFSTITLLVMTKIVAPSRHMLHCAFSDTFMQVIFSSLVGHRKSTKLLEMFILFQYDFRPGNSANWSLITFDYKLAIFSPSSLSEKPILKPLASSLRSQAKSALISAISLGFFQKFHRFVSKSKFHH